jgi:hypothetical protein
MRHIGNVHILSKEELAEFANRFTIVLDKKYLIINANGRDIKLAHSLKEKFSVTFGNKKDGYKKIVIQPEASTLWAKNFKDECSLFEIQNILNAIKVNGEEPSVDNINEYLKKGE